MTLPGYTIRADGPIWRLRSPQVSSSHPSLPAAAHAAQAIDTRPGGGERDMVLRCVDLILLDREEVNEGYMDGLRDREMQPGPNRSRAYWHGWHQAQPFNEPRPHPQVALVEDMRAVLGDDFLSIIAEFGIGRGEPRKVKSA